MRLVAASYLRQLNWLQNSDWSWSLINEHEWTLLTTVCMITVQWYMLVRGWPHWSGTECWTVSGVIWRVCWKILWQQWSHHDHECHDPYHMHVCIHVWYCHLLAWSRRRSVWVVWHTPVRDYVYYKTCSIVRRFTKVLSEASIKRGTTTRA